MAHNTKFVLRTDVMPSNIILPPDNWRETPDVKHDELAKSMASVGLIHPPVVSETKDGKYIVIDGNRRTYVGQLLEKGYKTELNGTPVILGLPENWRVSVTKKKYEDLGEEEIDKIRLHSTEQHVHFNKTAKISQIWREAQNYATERGLTLNAIGKNKTLHEGLVNYISKRYQIETSDALILLKDMKMSKYSKEVIEPLHCKEISVTLAKSLSQNIEKNDIQPLINISRKHNTLGVNATQQATALTLAKKIAKRTNKDIKKIYDDELSKIQPIKTLTVELPPHIYYLLDEEKKKQNKTWDEFIVPTFIKYINIYIKS